MRTDIDSSLDSHARNAAGGKPGVIAYSRDALLALRVVLHASL